METTVTRLESKIIHTNKKLDELILTYRDKFELYNLLDQIDLWRNSDVTISLDEYHTFIKPLNLPEFDNMIMNSVVSICNMLVDYERLMDWFVENDLKIKELVSLETDYDLDYAKESIIQETYGTSKISINKIIDVYEKGKED